MPKEAGANRFVWNMRYPDPKKVEGYVASEGAMSGPMAAPGTYRARLTVGDKSLTVPFEIVKDPRIAASQADFDAQFALLLQVRDKLTETHEAINRLRALRTQVEEWERRTKGQKDEAAVAKAAAPLKEKLTAIEDELIQSKAKSRQDTLNFPVKLNADLAFLSAVVASADAAPTKQARELFADVSTRIDVQLARLNEVISTDIAAFNDLIRETGVPALVVPAPTEEK